MDRLYLDIGFWNLMVGTLVDTQNIWNIKSVDISEGEMR